MSVLRAVLFTLSLAVAANVSAKSPDMRAFAVETLQAWNQALNNKDAAKFSGLFTVDAVFLMPGGEAAAGIREIYAYVDDLVKNNGVNEHQIEVSRVGVGEDRIFITGRWNAAKAINGVSRGALAAILEKQYDGSWRTSFLKWN